jgi:RNA polymerase sigma-70 factor (ECF subfamily)
MEADRRTDLTRPAPPLSVAPAATAQTRAASSSFEAFYSSQVRAVTALAYALTGNWTVAEDLAQEAFARAFRDWKRVETFTRRDSWVKTVAANLATSRVRRLAAEGRALTRLRSRGESADAAALPPDVEAFLAAVRSLPRRQAQAAVLRYVDDLPVAEVAKAMECSEGTVKAHLHGARRRLLAQLGLREEEPE